MVTLRSALKGLITMATRPAVTMLVAIFSIWAGLRTGRSGFDGAAAAVMEGTITC